MEGEEPSIEEVRLQLHRILASAEFHSSEDARELLRFCVEKSLCGEYDVLRETQDVFSSQADGLRAKLGRYYSGEGRNEPIRIEVPAGTIFPQFSHHAIAADTAGERYRGTAYRDWAAPAVALFIVIGAGFSWRSQHPIKPKVEPVLRRLTSDLGLSTYPALSADGKWLAFSSSRSGEGNLDLYLQPVDAGDAIRLTQSPADEKEASFSPDGKTIAYRSERNSGGIYTIGTGGGEERLVAPLGRNPRSSPDGKRVLYWVQWGDFRPGSRRVGPAGGRAPADLHPALQVPP